jgi:hypothetical protein
MAGPSIQEEVLSYQACWENAEIEQVLANLNRLESKVPKRVLEQRGNDRKPYATPILVAQTRKAQQKTPRAILPVVARDLSRSGLGLLSPLFFEPEHPHGIATLIRGMNVFREGAVLDIGLRKESGDLLWLFGTVMRVCTVQHDFLDVGIRFNGKRNLELEFDFI